MTMKYIFEILQISDSLYVLTPSSVFALILFNSSLQFRGIHARIIIGMYHIKTSNFWMSSGYQWK